MAGGRIKGLLNSTEALMFNEEESREDETSHESHFTETSLVKSRKRTVVKRFRPEWLKEEIFAGWLKPIQCNPERCLCSVCGVILLAGHSELEKHAAGKKHSSAMKTLLSKSNELKAESYVEDKTQESGEIIYDNNMFIVPQKLKESFPKGTILQRLTVKETEKIPRPIIISNARRKAPVKRKADSPVTTHHQNLPENPDAKLIRMLKSDSEDEFDDEGESEDLDEHLPPSGQLLRELKAELKFKENKMIQEKQKLAQDSSNILKIFNFQANVGLDGKLDESFNNEKELEARLNLIEEKRRHELNIYKLRLIEMESRVKLSEAEAVRAEELHQLRTAHLQLQIQKEQTSFIVEGSEIQPDPMYDPAQQ